MHVCVCVCLCIAAVVVAVPQTVSSNGTASAQVVPGINAGDVVFSVSGSLPVHSFAYVNISQIAER